MTGLLALSRDAVLDAILIAYVPVTGLLFALGTADALKMVRRKIPKAELRRHIRETPFTRDEVQKLWNRFEGMDGDGSGRLNYQVRLSICSLKPHLSPSRLILRETSDGCFCRKQSKLMSSGATLSAHV